MNVYTRQSVFPNCFIVPSIQWWSPHPSQDKKATAEEGKVSCLTKAVLFKPKMELTTHSNRCTQNTEADCLALPYIILWNPSDPYLIKQGEMIPYCWQHGWQRNVHKLSFIYLSLWKNIRSVAILRYTSVPLQFCECTVGWEIGGEILQLGCRADLGHFAN